MTEPGKARNQRGEEFTVYHLTEEDMRRAHAAMIKPWLADRPELDPPTVALIVDEGYSLDRAARVDLDELLRLGRRSTNTPMPLGYDEDGNPIFFHPLVQRAAGKTFLPEVLRRLRNQDGADQ